MCEFFVQKEHSPGSCAWLEHDAFLFCAVVEEERQEIVTLSVRDAARLREGGFWCRLPSLLSARPDCHVALISTGREVRLDSLREGMAAFPPRHEGADPPAGLPPPKRLPRPAARLVAASL